MAQKLSQRTALNGGSLQTDEVHVVRSGASYRTPLATLLNNGAIPHRGVQGTGEIVIFRKAKTTAQSSVLAIGDVAIFIDTTLDVMIVGIAVADVTTYPGDLRDNTKFIRFYEGASIL